MKHLILAVAVLFSATASAQQAEKDTILVVTTDTVKAREKSITIKVGRSEEDSVRKVKPSSKFSVQFTASRFDLGLSTYTDGGRFSLSPANSFLEREVWKSSNFGFEFFQLGYRFNSYFKIYAAAGLDWNHMRLKQNITIQEDQPTLTYVNETVEFKKNRFSSRYLRVPLSFQLRTKDDRKGNKAHFVFGPEVGFLLNGKVKQVSEANGKDKTKDDFNLNPFRYGGFARLGYNGLGVYVKYYGSDVFADGQGPADFKNLSFGLMLGF